MINEKDLHEAIAECQGKRDPTANTCLKLAAYYTILDHMTDEKQVPAYSYAAEPQIQRLSVNGDSEFMQIINGKSMEDVFYVLDDLMNTLQVINPRLYNGVMSRL